MLHAQSTCMAIAIQCDDHDGGSPHLQHDERDKLRWEGCSGSREEGRDPLCGSGLGRAVVLLLGQEPPA